MKNYLRYAFIAVLAFIANMAFGQAYKTLTFPDDNKADNKAKQAKEQQKRQRQNRQKLIIGRCKKR